MFLIIKFILPLPGMYFWAVLIRYVVPESEHVVKVEMAPESLHFGGFSKDLNYEEGKLM